MRNLGVGIVLLLISSVAWSFSQIDEIVLDLGDHATNSNLEVLGESLHKKAMDEFGIQVKKVYVDQVSGFQAYHLKMSKSHEDISYFIVSATQIFYLNDEGKREMGFDSRDWLSNIAFGYPQISSSAMDEFVDDIVDASKIEQAVVSGSSLGGMIAITAGYLSYRKIKLNKLDVTLPKVVTFATPGMKNVIENLLHNKYDDELDEDILENLDAKNYIYQIDLVSKLGESIGENFLIDMKYVLPKAGEKFSIEMPIFQETLESHLHGAFKRAFQDGLTEYNHSPMLRGQYKFENLVLYLFKRPILSLLKGMAHRKYRKTEKAWKECLGSREWQTNIMNNCTDKWQFGCSKEVMKHKDAIKIYKKQYRPSGTRILRLPKVKWCEVVEP